MNNLQIRRVCAYCLNSILKDHQLGNQAIVFLAEQFDDWDVKSDWQIDALSNGRAVAQIYLVGHIAKVQIENWRDLIRPEHLHAFQPELHGIEEDDRYHPVSGIPFLDGDYEVTFSTNEIPMFEAPEQRMPRHYGGREPRVICSR